jgi:hypothetical protein
MFQNVTEFEQSTLQNNFTCDIFIVMFPKYNDYTNFD